MVEDLLRYVKFVAAPDDTAAAKAAAHFRRAGMSAHRVSTVETLELAKLAETTYFGLLIAYAQELSRWAELTGSDYKQVLDFFGEIDFLPQARFFPGFIGGHCVIPNIKLLQQVADSKLLNAVLSSNDLREQELRASTSDGIESQV
jgi:UDP-N-acetyl-D-mannosaminuronate dehydrogenase